MVNPVTVLAPIKLAAGKAEADLLAASAKFQNAQTKMEEKKMKIQFAWKPSPKLGGMAHRLRLLCGLIVGLSVISSEANAFPVSWTDWTSTAPSTVSGNLTVGSSTVGVTFSGAYSFAQTSGGINYWNPSASYISSAVSNAPPAADIIALNVGGSKTITFSQAVQDPLLALVSWNGNTVDFGVPIEILSFGAGYWGTGTLIPNSSSTGFFGSGEVHGVIRLPGSYTSITFTDTSENWHGLTVGITGLPTNPVPVPSSLLLFGSGLFGLVGLGRKMQKGRANALLGNRRMTV